jgi:hypothetical protein
MANKKARLLYALPLAAVALVLGVSQSSGGSSVVTASIQKNSDSCGELTGHKSIGKVTFSMVKGTVYATIELRGATPNTNYYAYLYYNPPCTYNTYTKIATDSSGQARKTISSPSFGYHDWFVDIYDTTDNETPEVHLP